MTTMDQPPTTSLSSQAIKAALEARWEDAISLNLQIIETSPKDIDSLNRLARAFFELNDLAKSEQFYKQVLEIDSYNPIAQKNLKIVLSCKKSGHSFNQNTKTAVSPLMFLYEPGKTKLVSLLKVAEPQRLSTVYCGMPLEIVPKNRGISILDSDGKYLGVLPDDVAFQLVRFIKGGNKYAAYAKSVKVNGLIILIRETLRSKKFRNQPSFLDSSSKPSSDIITSFHKESSDRQEVPEGSEDSENI